MNKIYFQYLLKSKRKLLVFLGVLNFLVPTLIYFISISDGWNYETAPLCIFFGLALTFVLSIILPLIHFSFIHNKKGVDTYFALPLSKKEIYLTNYVMLFLEIVIPHIVFVLPILCWEMMINPYGVNILYFTVYVISCVFTIGILLLGVCALILKTNTTMDAFIIIASYIMVPIFIYIALYSFIDAQVYGLSAYSILKEFITYLFLPLAFIKTNGAFLMDIFKYNDIYYAFDEYPICLCVFVLVGIISILSIVYDIKKRKAEDAEQLSTNIFTYPFVIALFTFTLLLVVIFNAFSFNAKAIFIVLIFILFSIMVCVYKRKITFTKKGIVLFLVTLLIGYTTLGVSAATNGFGLEHSYQNFDTIDVYQLRYNYDCDEYGIYIDVQTQVADDNIIKNKEHGEYTYKDFIDYLHNKQEKFVEEYKELDEQLDDYRLYHWINVNYKDGLEYIYGSHIQNDKNNLKEIIDELLFLENFDFLHIQIKYESYDGNGEYNTTDISPDTLKTLWK